MKKFLPILLVAAGLTLSAQVKAEDPYETFNEAEHYYERGGLTAGQVVTLCVPYDIDSCVGGTIGAVQFKNNANISLVTMVVAVPLSEGSHPKGGVGYAVQLNDNSTKFRVYWATNAQAKAVDNSTAMKGNLSTTAIYPKTLYQSGVMEPYIIGKYDCEGDACTFGFCKCGVNGTVGQYRAYLNMAEIPSFAFAPERSDYMFFGAEAVAGSITEVDDVKVEKVVCKKMFVNGQLVIEKDGVLYNSLGQQL